MTSHASSRRAFVKIGALLAAPLAASVPPAALAADGDKTRLARLQDEAAIRALHQDWLRRVSTADAKAAAALFTDPRIAGALDRSVRGITPDPAGEPDLIEIAADGASAAGRFACVTQVATILARDCTLAQMAHAQGGGAIVHAERRRLRARYVKLGAAWAIASIELERM